MLQTPLERRLKSTQTGMIGRKPLCLIPPSVLWLSIQDSCGAASTTTLVLISGCILRSELLLDTESGTTLQCWQENRLDEDFGKLVIVEISNSQLRHWCVGMVIPKDSASKPQRHSTAQVWLQTSRILSIICFLGTYWKCREVSRRFGRMDQ